MSRPNTQVDGWDDLEHPPNVRANAAIVLVSALLATGCGGDDEPSRGPEAGTTSTAPAARTATGPATKAEPAPSAAGNQPAATSTTPRQGPKKKTGRGGSGEAKAPARKPADPAEALEAEDKVREGDVPILGGGKPDQ